MADSTQIIKKIRCSNGHDHSIEATQLTATEVSKGYVTYGDIHNEIEAVRDLANGVVDTYVIKSSKSSTTGYDSVVKSTLHTTGDISISTLSGLVDNAPATGTYHVGDIILMEEGSADEPIFDRWVSEVTSTTVKLTVLETQVAKHHHTIGTTTSAAITTVTSSVLTAKIPVVGDAVDVVTSVTGGTFVKSVSLTSGSDNLSLTSDSTGLGHSHSIDAHDHTVKITNPHQTLVSNSVNAYTTLTSKNLTTHSHTAVSVAGATSDDSITYVTGGGSDTFIKSLKEESKTTSSASSLTATGGNGVATTNTQTSDDTIGDVVKTKEDGAHTHTVSVTTTGNVVKSATVAPTVVTSVSLAYTSPSVAGTVVTSVPSKSVTVVTSWKSATSASFINSATVESGVLSFGMSNAVTSATIVTSSSSVSVLNGAPSTATQTAGSASIDAPSTTQSVSSGTVTATGSAASSGSHSHGFSHTHTIPSHTHTIASHTHSYSMSVKDDEASAITSLTSSKFNTHKHSDDVQVASTITSESSSKVITGGETSSVISSLVSTETSLSVSSEGLTTNTKYYKLIGSITYPTIASAPTGTVTATSSKITPAAAGSEQAIKQIEFSSENFVTSVTSSGNIKTSENKGGK